jgi:hypothetical protein
MSSKKKPQAGLTLELMEKLSKEAYCFNLEHETEIERLKADIDRLLKEKEDLKRQIGVQESKLKEEHLKVMDGKKGEFEDLRDANAKLEDENATWGDLVRDLEIKLALSKEETKREFRKAGMCFDFMHKTIEGRRGHTLSIPELFTFTLSLLYRGPDDPFGDNVQIFLPAQMTPHVERAKKTMDVKKARDLGEDLKRGDLSKYLKGGPDA